MAVFQFRGTSKQNRLLTGSIEAGDQAEAVRLIEEMGVEVSEVTAAPVIPAGRVSHEEFLYFNQQLAAVANAGIPLDRGLRDLAVDLRSRSLRRLINAVADDIAGGTPVDQAFARYEKQFPALYSDIFKAGVASGRLGETLTGLNRHLQLLHQTRQMIWEAVSYPAVVLLLAAVLVSVIAAFLIPQFREIFLDFHTALPGITHLVFTVTDHIGAIWIGVGVCIAVVLVVRRLLDRSRGGRLFKENLLLSVPVLGRLYRNSLLARMIHSLATAVSAGTPLPAGLRIAAGATGSIGLIRDCELLAQRIEAGQNLTDAALATPRIPRLFTYAVQVGAQRNELPHSLNELADMYEQHAQQTQGSLRAFLLPLLLIGLGCVIGILVLSMFLPLVALIDSVSGGKG